MQVLGYGVISPCYGYGCVTNVSYTATHDRTANLHTTNSSTWTLIKVSWSHLSLHLNVYLINIKPFPFDFTEHELTIKMDSENLALAQEEATLTKIRNYLNTQKVKLWEPPYYDPEKKCACEVSFSIIDYGLLMDQNFPCREVSMSWR